MDREDTVVEKGISRENIDKAIIEISEKVGEEWISGDRAILSCYGRDFTIAVGKSPNIVVLPKSTEEVQDIIRIANKYEIPVVPFSTGFNHGGLTLPRVGGIVIDLKRMDKIVNIDEDALTVTIQPHVRNAVLYQAVNNRFAAKGLKLRPALSLSMGSASALANYVARGGSSIMLKVGNTPEFIVNMTWVLPDGELLKLGPFAVPEVGNVPVQWGPGPELAGIFINTDGMFGVCTEMTIKILPEWPVEEMHLFDSEDSENTLETACDFLYKICQEEILDFVYKSSYCQLAVSLGVGVPEELAETLPENPVIAIIAGWDEEEASIRREILLEVAEKAGMYDVDVSIMGDDLMFGPEYQKKIGPKIGSVMGFKGAFQFTASYVKIEKIPEITKKYYKIRDKYWKSSDTEVTSKMSMTGTAIQGPLPFARCGTLEYDLWWDQGNPEEVKRAALMIRKANELNLKCGAPLWRNMYSLGEIHLPLLGTYYELLKKTKRIVDPNNIMHRDINPVTEDYL